MTIKLVKIDLPDEALLFTENFVESLGGQEQAQTYLLDIIDRYFNSEYIDFELNESN